MYISSSYQMPPKRSDVKKDLLLGIGRVNLVIGSPGSGKSNLIHWLIKSHSKAWSYGFVICPSAYDGGYDFMDTRFVKPMYQQEFLEDVVAIQSKKESKPMLLVLDDCLGFVKFNTDIWRRTLMTSRHLKMTVIIASQHVSRIPTEVREACSNVFMFKQNTKNAMVAVYDSFLQHKFDSPTDAKTWFNQVTDARYSCLCYRRDEQEVVDKYIKLTAPEMTNDKYVIMWEEYK